MGGEPHDRDERAQRQAECHGGGGEPEGGGQAVEDEVGEQVTADDVPGQVVVAGEGSDESGQGQQREHDGDPAPVVADRYDLEFGGARAAGAGGAEGGLGVDHL
ncbi:hypothetical protein ACH4ZX_27275 [Streptomyces sp. NPDC020490]|uniref:hypothetical protein n=1 Tax=Streptomyces sp. NPDC020490 TaxID=3365078 RepID=UPI0037A09DB9